MDTHQRKSRDGMDEEIVLIPLSGGGEAIIDAADAEIVAPYTWWRMVIGHLEYAYGRIGGGPTTSMHRLILGMRRGDPEVDHRDGNGLNNRRKNLRPCTHSQNLANRGPVPLDSRWSRFKGVTYKNQRWVAHISCRGHMSRLGTFRNEADAARAYDVAAERMFGEFARTNAQLGLYEQEPTFAQIKAAAWGRKKA